MITSAEVGIFKLVWDMVNALLGWTATRKENFFKNHVEPLQTKMISVHSDYVAGFQEIRRHLKNQTEPPNDIVDFMKERRRLYEHDRFIARDLALEIQKLKKESISSDLWNSVNNYAESILDYFSATASLASPTWYTDFMGSVETSIRMGFGKVGETVWREAGFSGSPRQDLINLVDIILDKGLPHGFAKVSKSYAAVKMLLV